MNYESRKKQRIKKKLARERRIFRLRLGILLLFGGFLFATFGFFIISQVNTRKNHAQSVNGKPVHSGFSAEKIKSGSANYKPALPNQPAVKDTDTKIAEIRKNSSLYPSKLLELLEKNEEVVDFVLNYPEKSSLPPAETIGDTPSKGSIPLLLQWDERWGYAPYGEETIIAISGCGPTCIAMVAAGLTADNTITPAVVAEYSSQNGYLDKNLNTSWELMTIGCRNFGISGTMLGLDENAMANTLAAGYPIICSMAPGIFTTTGHFIVLTGYENGSFTVNDPASRIRSSRTYKFSEFQDQIKNMWYFTADKSA